MDYDLLLDANQDGTLDAEYSLDGKTYKTYDNPLKLPISKDFKISARAYDYFGNISETGLGLDRVKTGKAPSKGLLDRLFDR